MKPLKHFLAVLLFSLAAWTARGQSPFGGAITFDGTNQYVNIPNFGSIIPTNEITVEFWANTSLAAGQSAFILDPDNGNNRLNAHLNYGTSPPQGVTYWDFGNISGTGRLGPFNAPVNSIGNWVHYAFVASQSGNFMSIYTNGTLMATRVAMSPFVRGAYDLHIGGSSNNFSYHGSIDDFRVWSVARSQAQIQAHLGVPLTGVESNLLVYYRFDNTNGTVAVNSATATGSAYNGTLINSPSWITSTVGNAALLNSVVTNAADSGPGTLRNAIANALPGTTVTFAAGLSGSTIALASGALALKENLTIDASSLPAGLAIDGLHSNQIFTVSAGVSNYLAGLTLTNGNGGAILNSGTLELNQCLVISNTTTGLGGGVFNHGTLTVNACTFVGNSTIRPTGIEEGGGIDSDGTLTVNQSTFTGNSAQAGGAIYCESGGKLVVIQSTIVSNSGGGISVFSITPNQFVIDSTIVAGNRNGDIDNLGYGYPFGVTNNCFIGGDPGVGPLADNGGPTPTMALLPGSPAINGAGPIDEIQQITLAGSSNGTFVLTFNGATTLPISPGATAAQIGSALNSLTTVGGVGGSVSVTAAGSTAGQVYTVTFGGTLSGMNLNQLSANPSGGATTTVSTVLDGMPMPVFDQRGPAFPRLYGGAVDIGAYELSPDITASGVAVAGTEGSATGPVPVAGFTNRLGGTTPADYVAAITWGDGTPVASGTVTTDSMGNFSVVGNHTYAEEGSYAINVTITNTVAATPGVAITSTANIQESVPVTQGNIHLSGVVGVAISQQTVATFTDPGGPESVSDYSAVILWGDGAADAGIITENPTGQFQVAGSHVYTSPSSYMIAVFVNHEFTTAPLVNSFADIGPANTTIAVIPSTNPSVYGQPVTCTATVNPPTQDPVTPTGAVQFIVDGSYFGSPVPLTSGTPPTTALPILAAGQHAIAATYSGDANFVGSLGISTLTVNKADTFAAVGSSVNPSTLGQAVTFTATVSVATPGAGTPTGSMQFVIDGGNAGAPVALDNNGQAEMTTSSISATGSPHAITAQYLGDPNFNAGLGTLSGGQVVTSKFATPLVLTAPATEADGSFGFIFTNLSGASFTVFASTNPALPLSAWSNLGPALESPSGSGHFQFTDPQATNTARRFYVVHSP